MRGFFARLGFDPEERRDLTQDTFLRVSKNVKTLRSEVAERQWLFTIAANVYRNELRRRGTAKRSGRHVSLDSEEYREEPRREASSGGSEDRNPLDDALLADDRRRLRRALAELPARMRRCTLLRLGQELGYQEIATLLQISPSTVKVQLHQARKRLLAALDPGAEGPEDDS